MSTKEEKAAAKAAKEAEAKAKKEAAAAEKAAKAEAKAQADAEAKAAKEAAKAAKAAAKDSDENAPVQHASIARALEELGSLGLPNGEFHIVNVDGGCFILGPQGQVVSPFVEADDEEGRKRTVKTAIRFNQRGAEVATLIKKRQEDAGKQGREYRVTLEHTVK